jgi:hypothetical protein
LRLYYFDQGFPIIAVFPDAIATAIADRSAESCKTDISS